MRDAKCWNIFPVEVAVCSSWRRGQESGVTGSGHSQISTQYLHSIYTVSTVSTVSTQYPHRQPGVSWSRWAHRCTRAAHTGWRAHTHSSVTRDTAEEQLSVSVTRPRTSVTCHAVSRSPAVTMVTADQASPLDLSRPVSRATPPPPPKLRACSPSDGARRRPRSRSRSRSGSGGSLSPVSSLSVTPGPSDEDEAASKQHFTTKRFLHKYRAEQSRGENALNPESLVNNKDLISYGKNNPPIFRA